MFGQLIITLPLLWLVGNVDFANPLNILLARVFFCVAQAGVVAVCFYCLYKITAKADRTTLEVTAKPDSPMAGMMGGDDIPPAPTVMTVEEYDLMKVKENIKKTLMSLGLTFFIHLQFGFMPPLIIQAVMGPFQLYQTQFFRVHVLGQEAVGDLARPWVEAAPFASVSPHTLSLESAFVLPPISPLQRHAAGHGHQARRRRGHCASRARAPLQAPLRLDVALPIAIYQTPTTKRSTASSPPIAVPHGSLVWCIVPLFTRRPPTPLPTTHTPTYLHGGADSHY